MWPNYSLMDEAGDTSSTGGGDVDIDKTVDSLAGDLGLKPDAEGSAHDAPSPDADKDKDTKAPLAAKLGPDGKPLPEPKAPPKSWSKEHHEAWGKLDPKVQDYVTQRETEAEQGIVKYADTARYGNALREVITPYQPLLDAQGIKDHGTAVRYLLNAHYQLSTGDPDAKAKYFASLAKSYGVDMTKALAAVGGEAAYQDPNYVKLAGEFEQFKGAFTASQQAQFEALKAKTAAEVETFAKDPAHPYFEEVGDHIALLLQDPRLTLAQAYEQAVWANPVTRAKEQARLQKESEEALRKKAAEDAEKARKTKGLEPRDTSTRRSPQEPLGDMESTMRETLATIKAREKVH